MDPATGVASPSRGARVFHGALLVGLVTSGGLFAFARRVSPEPASLRSPIIPFALAGAAVVLLFIAARVIRPTIPERRFDQPSDAYWAEVVRGRQIVLWAMIEGPGLISVLGYYLTASVLPALTFGAAVLMLIAFRPGRLEAVGAA